MICNSKGIIKSKGDAATIPKVYTRLSFFQTRFPQLLVAFSASPDAANSGTDVHSLALSLSLSLSLSPVD
jgi:hypothetical protein